MKKKLSIAILLLAAAVFDPFSLSAQGKIEITPMGGYMFGGKIRFYEGDFKIKDNADYGLALDAEVAHDTKIEISWNHMISTAEFNPYFGYDELQIAPFDIYAGYIQVGAVREMDLDNVTPFGLLTIGTAYFIPQGTRYDQTWKFGASLGGGAKIWLSDHLGIRLQGRLLMPMFWGGAGLSVGTGGAGVSVGASTTMLQGDFLGGLIFAFGD